ncbi:MAG: guanylate kinase [Vampirovibrio sp.]|nr:guanylate kinase [Vampirovibrio sp.]
MNQHSHASSHGNIIVLSGPSGVGKGTLCQLLRKRQKNITISISATSRQPRPGEEDGVHYYFLSREDFMAKAKTGGMLEWAEYNGNFYGTPKEPVDVERAKGNHVLLEIDVQGALQVKAADPNACLIFIEPPSLDELRRRLETRNQDAPEVIERRMVISTQELTQKDQFDHQVTNQELEACYRTIEATLKTL